ncbi:hypothetical protein [Rhizobacter sp. OV335]|uniref:hypothetical protein n=1 Tax=Rhizobacter sp. OV335 TaxID=1500264 RepID=UPI0009112AAA|nr:hypothetical protein [Rhizobacter sp. OV335]SHN40044.1 hypothetical protein SAMN02787076_06157 [Rhizobacter sp. OV335]
MPAITYADFSGGLDRRLPINVQEASRLWVLRNAYITLGKRVQKRPAIDIVSNSLTGSVGLKVVNDRLTVFTAKASGFTPPPGVSKIELDLYNPYGIGYAQLTDVVYAEQFQGFPYVVGYYFTKYTGPSGFAVDGYTFRHSYVDGNPSTLITDSNCPHTRAVTKAASRIFAIADEVVRYSAAGAARDWTTASDAGFLPTSLQQDTSSGARAVGGYADKLVVFFAENAQIWTVAVDPSANAFVKRIDGVGCYLPQSLATFANDLIFLSPFGFRSMTQQAQTDRIDDNDVGVAIDKLVVPDIDGSLPAAGVADQVFGQWIPQLGQYWAIFNMGTYSKAWVYTYSRSSKIACWSEYTFPIIITAATTRGGEVFMRTAGELYKLSTEVFVDQLQTGLGDTPIPVEVQMAFQDAKQPGVAKQFFGADYVVEGSPSVSFKYDPRDLDKEGVSMTIPGDTRPGEVQGVEMVCSSIAPVFRHAADEDFSLSAMSLYYNSLGLTR